VCDSMSDKSSGCKAGPTRKASTQLTALTPRCKRKQPVDIRVLSFVMRNFAMRLPRKVSSWFSIISVCLFVTRFVVLFAESWSIVRSERSADANLLNMCSQGVADESQKFRSLCIQARAEQAAPLLLKATLRAIKTAFSDFLETFHSPSRIALLVLFCVSGLALPVVKAASTVLASHLKPEVLDGLHGLKFKDDDDQEACSVVVLEGGGRGNMYERLRRLPQRMARRRSMAAAPTLSFVEEEEYDGKVVHGAHWQDIHQ